MFVHEFGHFITAKRSGMAVEEFGFGFPPRLWSIKKGETRYSINAIPFGGFVKITGEDGAERNNPKSFAAKSGWARALVLVAGVSMNVLLAFVLLALVNTIGLRVGLFGDDEISRAKDIKIQIIDVKVDSPAALAKLTVLDEIIGFQEANGEVSVTSIDQVQQYINSHKGQEISIKIRSGDVPIIKKLTPRINPPGEEGALGISLATTGIVRYPLYQAVIRGAQDTGTILVNTAIGYGTVIKNLFIQGKPGVDLSGPVGLAVITGQASKLGFTYLLQFTALISINLAILNIIPFPALDGGRLFFLIIEKIKRSPLSKKVELTANTVGFALLLLLMIYVTTKDIIKLF